LPRTGFAVEEQLLVERGVEDLEPLARGDR
jgi:hypothetical protein